MGPGKGGPLPENRPDLRADCANCFGLCCVATAFAASADFAFDRPAGTPCRNLLADFRCGVHAGLRDVGMRGCTVYDCFGAGQKISQTTFGGRDWRSDPAAAAPMFAAFPIMRDLHELLWYLEEALALPDAAPVHADLREVLAETEKLTLADPGTVAGTDVMAQHGKVNPLLARASELVRARAGRKTRDHRGADLMGARLKGADLRGANLRGAYLIAADLRNADLRLADLIGADLRDTDLRGADLTGALFLIQSQLNAARGDAATRIPPSLARPAHWTVRR
ncbi:pentapeptide repeat-containing protein [Spirillospora sp. NPDC050679]